MDPKYGSGIRNHCGTDPVIAKNETKSSSPIIFCMDSIHESKSRTSSDSILNRSISGSSKRSEPSCSTFSSSSDYSSDDFILMNPKTCNSISSNRPSSKFPPDAKPLSQEHYNDLKLNTSRSAALHVSDDIDESLSPTVSTKSPSTQVMERLGGYDPNRVPSSIFGIKSSTRNEWSAGSDESLFSISVSLSGDHGDSWNSGELGRIVESNTCEEISKSGKQINFRHLPVAKEEHMEKISDTKKGAVDGNNFIEAGSLHMPIKKEQHVEEEIKLRGNRDYSTAIGHSKGNGVFRDSYSTIPHSNGKDEALAFPTDRKSAEPFSHVIYYPKKKSRWPLCFYSNCSYRSCCRWPSCCCKYSGCFSCKWLSCFCCCHKWSRKQWCCCCK